MVSAPVDAPRPGPMHPVHAFLLAASVSPFLGAALSDYAYLSSEQVQWINFASWLIVGGLVFGTAALGCGLVAFLRADRRNRMFVPFALLLAMCVLGVIDAFVHARDAWASMPTGLVLSVIVAVMACAVTWIGFASLRLRSSP